jgi:hypothetical protein
VFNSITNSATAVCADLEARLASLECYRCVTVLLEWC